MNREQATALIFEMLAHAAKRGAFSSVEIEALKKAEEVIKQPAKEAEKEG